MTEPPEPGRKTLSSCSVAPEPTTDKPRARWQRKSI